MAERETKVDTLELKFKELETECLECIRTKWTEDPVQGANVEISANEDSYLTLSLNSDGKWTLNLNELLSAEGAVVGEGGEKELGKNPPLDTLLFYYAALDNNFLGLVLKWLKTDRFDEMAHKYVARNRKRLANGLMGDMQELINESKGMPELALDGESTHEV
jgi:hypothetical protein